MSGKKTLRQEAREGVARGAKRLDRLRPGYYRRVDLDALDISKSGDCIAVQVEKTRLYDEAFESLGFSLKQAERYGMYVSRSHPHQTRMYSLLTYYWKQEIRARLAKDRARRLRRRRKIKAHFAKYRERQLQKPRRDAAAFVFLNMQSRRGT